LFAGYEPRILPQILGSLPTIFFGVVTDHHHPNLDMTT